VADCDWAILCDYAFHDVNRKTCLIGIFDRINVPSVPTTHHQAALALKFVGDAREKVTFKIEVVRPAGGTLTSVGGEIELAEAGSGELQLNMAGLPLPDFGPYAFNVYLGGQLAKTTTFTVAELRPQPAGQD
jgi:hypothetical protein